MTQYVTGISEEKLQLKADVLLIEDEPLVSALIRRYLASLKDSNLGNPALQGDYHVVSLETGFDLLRTDLSNVKVAIVDILLPQITGVDLIRDFRKRFPNMGIIAVSGMATEPMKRSLQEVLPPELKFLSKPLRKDEFFDAFSRAWNFYNQFQTRSEQQRQTGPLLLKEGEEELWTAVKTNTNQTASITVERRPLSRKKIAA